jgi:hypothetical protein
VSLVRITQEIVGAQYELGARDCFRVVYDYIRRYVDLPEAWRGLTLEDYARVFEDDPVRAKELIEEFLGEHLQSIPVSRVFAGDVLMLDPDDHPPFPAVHAGNRHFVGAEPRRGVAVLPLANVKIRRAWRCQPAARA